MPAGRAELRIGCSGWQYDDWRGVFYPQDLPKRRWFSWYTDSFDTVELNSTFYRLPEPSTFDEWRSAAPRGFLFALKLSRYGTHLKHLADPTDWVGNFVERAERLGPGLGPILAQLPPHWHADPGRLDAFLDATGRRNRWAVEVRDESWLCEPVYRVLRRHNAALCVHDLVRDHPRITTADWQYLRLHGPDPSEPYRGSYSSRSLAGLARRIRRHLRDGADVHVYFNNDIGASAVSDALTLRRYVGEPDAPAGRSRD